MSLPDKASEERQEKIQRLNYMIGMKKAEISTMTLELESLQALHTDLTYLEEN